MQEQKRVTEREMRALQPDEPDAVSSGGEGDSVHEGDQVMLRDNPTTRGVVLDEPASGKVTVAFGSMRMQVELSRLKRLQPPAKKETVSTQHLEETVNSNEVDVRGMYGDEAIREIDRFLYQAYSMGLQRVDIIHGKGTGALRTRVHSYLRDVSFVEHYALGEWNEGGSGMTKVYFHAN